jgi:hypothetical protein
MVFPAVSGWRQGNVGQLRAQTLNLYCAGMVRSLRIVMLAVDNVRDSGSQRLIQLSNVLIVFGSWRNSSFQYCGEPAGRFDFSSSVSQNRTQAGPGPLKCRSAIV